MSAPLPTKCPRCSDTCTPTGATTCWYCGLSPLPTPGAPPSAPSSWSPPVPPTTLTPGITTVLKGEVTNVTTLTALPPRDVGVYALIAALILIMLPALFVSVIVLLFVGSCSGVSLFVASLILRPRSNKLRSVCHIKVKTMDGLTPLVLMVEPNGAPTIGERVLVTGKQLRNRMFYASRLMVRSERVGKDWVSRGDVVFNGRRPLPLYVPALVLVVGLVVWLVVWHALHTM